MTDQPITESAIEDRLVERAKDLVERHQISLPDALRITHTMYTAAVASSGTAAICERLDRVIAIINAPPE